MNKLELQSKLKSENVSRSLYSLEGGLPNERLCLDYESGCWIVYYSERGGRSGVKKFTTEEAACQYIYDAIKGIVTGKVK
jgi:hypothetical protein